MPGWTSSGKETDVRLRKWIAIGKKYKEIGDGRRKQRKEIGERDRQKRKGDRSEEELS